MKYLSPNLAGILVSAALLVGAASANAGWIRVADPDLSDAATNPGGQFNGTEPSNQNPDTVAAWVEDLVGLAPDTLDLLAEGDDTPASLDVPDFADYITVHYGNLPDPDDGNGTIAYVCDGTDCGTFVPETLQGISDYRIYDNPGNNDVPEPGSLALLGAGLVGLGLIRRKRAT